MRFDDAIRSYSVEDDGGPAGVNRLVDFFQSMVSTLFGKGRLLYCVIGKGRPNLWWIGNGHQMYLHLFLQFNCCGFNTFDDWLDTEFFNESQVYPGSCNCSANTSVRKKSVCPHTFSPLLPLSYTSDLTHTP